VIFVATPLPGAFVVEPEYHEDHRGFFARTWCAREFAAHGLSTRLAQCSVSLTKRRGTLRGLHYQAAPYAEAKLVRCTAGGVHDVIVDLRPTSPTYRRHLAVTLTAGNRKALFVPQGFAHGFQTLADETEVFYQISAFHSPDHARGIRWDDPAFAIAWPLDDPIVNDRDRAYPDFAG
jgi:dTDP-4-dehydrorhamnose 3,5-epimerase